MPSFDAEATPAEANDEGDVQESGFSAPLNPAPPSRLLDSIEAPRGASVSLPADLSIYDLTVSEALAIFAQENRKQPAIRTLQRYCQEGRFQCCKLKTTRNGKPVHEWIINGTSLRTFIQSKPEENEDEFLAPPGELGDAHERFDGAENVEAKPLVVAPQDVVGDAIHQPVLPRNRENQRDVMATLDTDGDATEVASKVELLVENAKLTAQLDAQEDLIGELRDDKKFMREQITHQRGNDTLMADMHRETLGTLKAVSVAGRHTKIEMPDPSKTEPASFYETHNGEGRPPAKNFNDV